MHSQSASGLLLLLLLLSTPLSSATEPEHSREVDLNNPAALQEATRILAEEVKLAARPQTYVIVDLVHHAVVIKGRGVELHRFPIADWSAAHLADVSTTFRLQARPPVGRRKIEPAAGSEQPPVSLDDMPTDFTLQFTPPFSLTVHPSASGAFWRWLRFTGRESWRWLQEWTFALATGTAPPMQPLLYMTVDSQHAQSLAWTVTEGMPFLVQRPPS
jgi:hypothetical protein